jgi:hypothetical protein
MAPGDERPRRVELGFEGGQVIAVRLTTKQIADLRKELGRGQPGWHDVETADGEVSLDLGKVVFVRGEPSEHRVGFIS